MKNTTTAVIGNLMANSSSTSLDCSYSEPEIISASVLFNTVEIIKRARPMFTYTVIGPNSQPPDKVWKEVWGVIDGELTRLPDIIGTHEREYTVPEQISFT